MFAVECLWFRSLHKSRESAERQVAVVERLGGCHGPHEIREVTDAEERPAEGSRSSEDQ